MNPRSDALIQPPLPNPRRTPYAPRRATRRTPFAVRQQYDQATSWVAADRYQDASELAYHLPGHPVVMCTCLRGRRNQYELWPAFADTARLGDALVLLLDEREGVHETTAALAPYFSSVTRGELAPLLRGADTVSVRRIWVLENYRGGWPARDAP